MAAKIILWRHSMFGGYGCGRLPTIRRDARPKPSEFDLIQPREDGVVAQLRSVGDLPDRELFLIRRFRRQSIDRNDRLEAALHGAEGCIEDGAVRRGADDDDGLDALVLEDLLQVAAGELVATALDHLFVALGTDAGNDVA